MEYNEDESFVMDENEVAAFISEDFLMKIEENPLDASRLVARDNFGHIQCASNQTKECFNKKWREIYDELRSVLIKYEGTIEGGDVYFE